MIIILLEETSNAASSVTTVDLILFALAIVAFTAFLVWGMRRFFTAFNPEDTKRDVWIETAVFVVGTYIISGLVALFVVLDG